MDRQKVARHILVVALALTALAAGCGSDDASAADEDRSSAGTEVHELTAPDGRRYVLQSFSHIVDGTHTIDTLAGLGDRLDLPEGWTFAHRVLDEQLDVLSADDGIATVVQDDLQNTYQRVDEGVEG